MFPIIGIVVVFGSIIGGYLLEQGNLHILIQPAELVIIGGAALGALFITCPPKVLVKIAKGVPQILGSGPNKSDFLDLLGLLFSLFSKCKKEGLLALESDIENPHKSPLFKKHPSVLKNHHAVEFICDNFRVYILGIRPFEFEEMMDLEIEAHHQESALAPSVISKIADSLPGFGIVAAVLGVVITMGKMSESPEVIGHSIAAALVGTFLGILLCYGFLGPIGSNLEHRAREDAKYFEAIKVAILAFAREMPPQLAVEAARRVLLKDTKPTFKELEKNIRKKAA
ncbi:MAG TPA: flagellar motor stator protein MotA [Deltaproteobacteria bacterium]|nr:MAG: flagellar motor stator protein MotA [Deltaproteobacteria bacterium GWA2_55_82]OGQ64316.1 MAG: flagellar motor stator protein MotA [Deltaproteobacteria bacterium RIFCSPLOWO2_02_FULL_55_12]OIJ74338.1 MAG: flagellar motor stator protein MotA [Deltaproteobacteria bacterium GWC2_55_46]HBG46979.1 flagellar motor stator protein MotA [Deltaproteobacteria bacterium]HCY10961.1 flagellar motor stator protein MotA [Deltaproteobacteria bacterium]